MDEDIIVVGGRCAGASTAMLLARAGFRVRVVERSPVLGDTLSGHMVNAAGTARLQAWGLLDAVLGSGSPAIDDAMTWVAGQPVPVTPGAASGAGPDGDSLAPPQGSTPPAVAPRRGLLDPILLDAARQAGATVNMGNAVRALLTDGFRVTGVVTDHGEHRARLVIGADGRNSRVARLVGATKYVDSPPATYAYYAYWNDVSAPGLRTFLDEGRFVGMFPTNDDLFLVFFQSPHAGFDDARHDPMSNYLDVLAAQPAAMELLNGSTIAEPLRGTGDLPTFFRVSAGPGWVLGGDAGHHKDPLIARGIPDAFRDAELIAQAVTSGWDGDLDQTLAGYPARRDACARPLSAATDALTSRLGAMPADQLAKAFAGLIELEATLDPPGSSR